MLTPKNPHNHLIYNKLMMERESDHKLIYINKIQLILGIHTDILKTITKMNFRNIFFIFSIAAIMVSCGETKNEDDIVNAFIGYGEKDVTELQVGDKYGGGIIVYIFKPSDYGYVEDEIHGIIASTKDLPETYSWSNSYKQTGADNERVGYATSNTRLITAVMGKGSYAAFECVDYNYNDFSDWLLPTIDELKILYELKQKNVLKNFQPASYWSSTELYNDAAKGIHFDTGEIANYYKEGKAFIRPIRYF